MQYDLFNLTLVDEHNRHVHHTPFKSKQITASLLVFDLLFHVFNIGNTNYLRPTKRRRPNGQKVNRRGILAHSLVTVIPRLRSHPFV